MEQLYKDAMQKEHYWLDKETFVLIFGNFIDDENDEYYIECEYHRDNNTYHFTKVYEDDSIPLINSLSENEKNFLINKVDLMIK